MALAVVSFLGRPLPARASGCVLDAWENGTAVGQTIFPNWTKVLVASFDLQLDDDPFFTSEVLQGLTLVNFGSAGPGDLARVQAQITCNAANSGLLSLTFAGNFAEDSGSYPAWTWGGATPDYTTCADDCAPCTAGIDCCGAVITLDIFADVAPCPADLATVKLGLPFHGLTNTADGGPIGDDNGCFAPWDDLTDVTDEIAYAMKTGPDTAAPGDTVTYTLTWGRPGTAALTGITIMDSVPPYTHYVAGSASPAPDPLWDPDLGPPMRLRWSLPGGAVTGGPTSQLTYAVTVDWGNGEAFEPGSGNVAAPEGARLDNRAQVFFNGTTCSPTSHVNPPVTTVVDRFLFWKVGDNDLLFSASPGQPPDEMTYELFVQNLSPLKTWWNVSLWDTVPAELDPWCTGCGLEDPCAGWTMTPTGCAAAAAGRVVAGAATLMTWRLDLPPRATITVRWKGQVRGAATAGGTVVNRASLLALGNSGVVNGTGHSGQPRSFTHLATVILPTTYVSYVGTAGSTGFGLCPGFTIDFFPLNKKTQFELRGIEHQGAGWATVGGVSQSIGCLIGDCLGGFPGNAGCTLGLGAIAGGGIAGCKVERIPASYDPPSWQGVCPAASPMDNIYKVTANSPVLWQFITYASPGGDNEDRLTYAPATSLSYAGFMHYAWKFTSANQTAGNGDSLVMQNTGLDPYGVKDPAQTTTVHVFKFNYGTLTWDYKRSYDLGGEAVAVDSGTLAADIGPWRTISSDTQLIVGQAFQVFTGLGCCCSGCGNDYAALVPNAENGHVVSQVGTGTFYGLVQGMAGTNGDLTVRVVIGNTGAADATYRIWKYAAANPVGPAAIPPNLRGTAGTWTIVAGHVVPAGLANPGNPRIYNQYSNAFDAYTTTSMYKIELVAGGPIQILAGMSVYSYFGDGSIQHAANGDVAGVQYWLHQTTVNLKATCPTSSTHDIQVYCPKTNMAVRCVSESGYNAVFTSTGPDQCIAFLDFTNPAYGTKRNWRVDVQPGPAFGNVIAQYEQCAWAEKGYTAPFLQTGTHYLILAPAAVFSGQPFWITLVVIDASATTKTDYCGTTSFTSTDPGAKLESGPMDTYNFTWSSSSLCTAPPDEDGVRIFVNVVLTRLGLQTIVATDTTDGSIAGLTAIMVVGADVKLTKEPRFSVQASGDTVQFRICWSNYSSASAFTFVLTDGVPMGTTFVPEASTAPFDCGNTKGVPVAVAYATATTPSAPPAASFTAGNPAAATRWLRWTIPYAGINTTGCACFRVSVN